MKSVYPIVLTPDDEGYLVYVPDMKINTHGENLLDAIEMARDAISVCGIAMKDDLEQEIPAPTARKIDTKPDEIVTYVDVDFDAYRKAHEMRTIRKNCTIPSWLNEQAEMAGLNFSAILQKALKHELHLD